MERCELPARKPARLWLIDGSKRVEKQIAECQEKTDERRMNV